MLIAVDPHFGGYKALFSHIVLFAIPVKSWRQTKEQLHCVWLGIKVEKDRNTICGCLSFPSTSDPLTCASFASMHGEPAQTIDLFRFLSYEQMIVHIEERPKYKNQPQRC